MSLPNSDVGICNVGLDLLGQAPISSLSAPATPIESLCARWYDLTRGALLEAHSWNFANKGRAIPRGGTPAITKFPDYYDFPNDYRKLTAITDPDIGLGRWKYRIEGKSLLIDNGGEASLDTWYIHDITDVAQFSPTFICLLAGEVALNLAPKITKRPQVLSQVKSYVDFYRQRALASNGQAQPAKRYERSKFVNAGLYPNSGRYDAGPHEFNFDAN